MAEPMSSPSAMVRRQARAEVVAYAIAAATYIALGVIFQTVVLNWITGPLYAVVVVSVLTPRLARRRGGAP